MTDRTRGRRRRRVLGGLLTVALAGCVEGDGSDGGDDGEDAGGDDGDDATGGATTGDGTTAGGGTSGATTAPTDAPDGTPATTRRAADGGELDLREANVTAVAVSAASDGYRFDVTLHHDDDGEDGYANWWQVETLAGERLGRRDLLHAHGTRAFTRSATVSVPAEADCVVVRGHDETHGYGGQAMVVTLATGATRAERQGSAPASFEGATCP